MDYGSLPRLDIHIEIDQRGSWTMRSYQFPAFGSNDKSVVFESNDKDEILAFLNSA